MNRKSHRAPIGRLFSSAFAAGSLLSIAGCNVYQSPDRETFNSTVPTRPQATASVEKAAPEPFGESKVCELLSNDILGTRLAEEGLALDRRADTLKLDRQEDGTYVMMIVRRLSEDSTSDAVLCRFDSIPSDRKRIKMAVSAGRDLVEKVATRLASLP